MISLCFNPLETIYAGFFDTPINHHHVRYYDELRFVGKIRDGIHISEINTEKLVTEADFTLIYDSQVKNIDVVGSLCLSRFANEIQKIKATGNVYVYNFSKISCIETAGNVYILKSLVDNTWDCECPCVKAKHLFYYYMSDDVPDTFLLKNISIREKIIFDERIKTVQVVGDCSQVPKIEFQGSLYSFQERKVIVKKGGFFYGTVIGGKLCFEI